MSESTETITYTKVQVRDLGVPLGSDQSEVVKRDFYDALAVFTQGTEGKARTALLDEVRESVIAKIAVNKGSHDGVKFASVSTMGKFAAYAARFPELRRDLSLEIPARARSAGGAETDADAVTMAHQFALACETQGTKPSIRTAREEWPTESATESATASTELGTDKPVSMSEVAAWMIRQSDHVVWWMNDPNNAEMAAAIRALVGVVLDDSQPDEVAA